MSQKFISLDDAAEQLGVSKERLNELREAGELRAYRDGASWKFRSEEIDKLVEAGGVASLSSDDDDDEIVLGVEPLGDGDDAESILLTEADDLEGGIPRPQSTIIGKSEMSLEEDLALKAESDLSLKPEPPAGEGAGKGADKTATFEDLEELELDLEAESSRILDPSAAAAAKDAADKAAEATPEPSDLKLDLEDDYELDIVGSDIASSTDVTDEGDPAKADELLSGSGSGTPGSIAGLSGLDALDLDDDEQDDLVLGDSDPVLSSSDSGINLAPSDSGIALDDVPLDLGGSAIGSALDLAALSAASAAQSKGDDVGLASAEDFELTPVSVDEDDEEDSSQIVALDEVEDDDEAAFEEVDDLGDGFGGVGVGVPSGADVGMGAAPAPVATASVEQVAFPGWIVGILGLCLLTMTLCGMMAFDLLQSMWAWDEPFSVNSTIMDAVVGK